jgi:hypothetical protein
MRLHAVILGLAAAWQLKAAAALQALPKDNTVVLKAELDGKYMKPLGCSKIEKVYGEDVYDPSMLVTVDKCMTYCEQKDTSFFLLSNGKKCSCIKAYSGSEVDKKQCETPCSGNNAAFCGGEYASEVYLVYDCTKKTMKMQGEEAEAKVKAVIDSYSEFSEETCGQEKGNLMRVDGRTSRQGTVDDCKMACWHGSGSLQCNGFTFEKSKGRCTFHYDVTAGEVTKSKDATCFWKSFK